MKSCVLAALLQFAIGKACDGSDWKACPSFNGDLQSCIQQDCCLWSNHDETCRTSAGPYKCPVEYFHHCSSLMPDCDSSEDTCGACSGDAMCSWRQEGHLWACSPTAHTSHYDPTTHTTTYECDDAPNPAPAPGPDPAPAPGPDPAPAPGPDPTPAPGPDPTPAPSAGVQIRLKGSSLCVDLPGGDTSNGALLWTWDCYGGETQQWSFQDGQLVYLPDPSKCVDLLGGDTTNGNRLGLWDCYGGDSQLWGFDSEWGTIYLASTAASDATKCAQIGGENRADPLVIWDCTIDPQQVWTVGSKQSSLAVV